MSCVVFGTKTDLRSCDLARAVTNDCRRTNVETAEQVYESDLKCCAKWLAVRGIVYVRDAFVFKEFALKMVRNVRNRRRIQTQGNQLYLSLGNSLLHRHLQVSTKTVDARKEMD